ncbi:LOW QUALITY PROTEIN: neurensin-2 [Excalfactoria chinensis]|uniref:LOW QUALITY PROTEIN: neurensin-2 n=1 Tax=Excalfactoria chinensis TaxID=46218 RepID=UPI003B3A949A
MPALQPSCSCSRGPSVAQGKWYGVRSYLHLFYEDCTGAGPDGDTNESSPPHPHAVWPSIIWKVTLSTGTLFLLVGLAALTTGWMLPPRLEGIEEEELVVLDVQAVRYNHVLAACRLLGTALCIAAAALGAVGLLCCVLGRAWGGSQEEEQQLSPILQSSTQGPAVPFGASQLCGVAPAGGVRLGALLLPAQNQPGLNQIPPWIPVPAPPSKAPVHHQPPPRPSLGHPSIGLQLLPLLPSQPYLMLLGACSGSSAASTASCPAAPGTEQTFHTHRWFPSFCSCWAE